MIWLKQSTARTVVIGPFVDAGDGASAETGLTISQADIRLTKNGAAFAQTHDATGATHMENGYYSVPLDTTDTGTLGHLRLAVHASGALPVWMDFMVVPANVWDSMFGSDKLEVDATLIEGGDATDAIRDALVDDSTRIDASALNTLSGHDPGEAIMGATDLGTGSGLTALASASDLATVDTVVDGIASDVAALNDLSSLLPNLQGALTTLGARAVTIASPVAESGTVTLCAGDDYAAADGRAVTFAVAVEDVPSLTGATLKLKCAEATWTATGATSDGTDWSIVFEPTAAQTAALTAERLAYEVEATLAGGNVLTLATGTLVVMRDIPEVV